MVLAYTVCLLHVAARFGAVTFRTLHFAAAFLHMTAVTFTTLAAASLHMAAIAFPAFAAASLHMAALAFTALAAAMLHMTTTAFAALAAAPLHMAACTTFFFAAHFMGLFVAGTTGTASLCGHYAHSSSQCYAQHTEDENEVLFHTHNIHFSPKIVGFIQKKICLLQPIRNRWRSLGNFWSILSFRRFFPYFYTSSHT